MDRFQIKDEFYLNGKKIKLISGACHYFRIVPEYWRDRLEKLKLLGCNSVETYIPWNIHEPKKGKFNFEGNNDLVTFVKIAEELGLLVILRPAPFICAEWDFGGLPYWLLKDDSMVIRSTYQGFLAAVDSYYEELFKHIRCLQITNGGPVIMMQIENEYGSFSNEKDYLKEIKGLMLKHGCNVPLFTSDGGWKDALEAGSMVTEGVLPTANLGSNSKEELGNLKEFMTENNIEGPLMCMEFWIGWFSHWNKEIIRRDPKDAAMELDEILKLGSVNIYMYHGGTNFGFFNGANYENKIEPQITSYDYDALLTEWGEATPKYELFKNVISKYKDIPTFNLSTDIKFKSYGTVDLSNKVSLFNTLDKISTPIYDKMTLNMEKLNQGFGYILYSSNIGKPVDTKLRGARIVDCDDRASVYANESHVITQESEDLGQVFKIDFDKEDNNKLDILVENTGRINYGYQLRNQKQKKGIKGGVMLDIHFHQGWNHYSLDFENINKVDFTRAHKKDTPGFYEYKFDIFEKADTFLILDDFGKGCAFINGFNLGRFWDKGPTEYLYIPAPLLKLGENTIVIFETEGKYSKTIKLSNKPKYREFL
ncbi:beta-galactosidase family protein [Clostridium sp.]|uniref:glycoside hydrolase family 35 protein n=1 Tax=Clostridium sp. TaxID=1506 RepID=UPI00260359F1|nr:beta-galactosidase family protein [Clostridium sp.]